MTRWSFYDPDQCATFDNDGRVESLLEITSEAHDETFAYAGDEQIARRIVASVNALATYPIEEIEKFPRGMYPVLIADDVIAALEGAQRLIDEALPKFDWGRSALDANAIQLLNEVPALVRRALEVVNGP